eukprot:SAG11_NODE_6434_length_1314_cov_1.483128_1_plen_102_part_00
MPTARREQRGERILAPFALKHCDVSFEEVVDIALDAALGREECTKGGPGEHTAHLMDISIGTACKTRYGNHGRSQDFQGRMEAAAPRSAASLYSRQGNYSR